MNRLWNRLTEPHSAVTDLMQRRDARLLAAVMLVFMGLYWPTTLLRLIFQPPVLPLYGLMMLVSAFLVIGLYALSRTQYYRLVVHLLNIYVGMIVVLMLAADTALALENNALTYLMLAVVLSGLLLSVRATLVVAVAAVGLTAAVTLMFTPPAFALLMSSTTQMNTIIGGLSVALAAAQQHNRRTIARQAHTLAESEASHRALFTALTDAVVVHQHGTIIQANEAFGETFGCAPADAVGQAVTTFIAPESQALVAQKAQSHLVECYETLAQHRDGRVFPVEISSRPYLHDGQRLRVSAIRDIQARKLAEQTLVEERNLLQAVINTIPDQVYVKDRDSRFILVNQSLLRRYALERPVEILGKTDFDLFGLEVAQHFYDGEQALIASGAHITASYDSRETLPNNAPLWVQVTKVPLRDSAGQVIGILGINRDITQNRLAEQERLELALERQHVEILRRFIAGLSHDLNTPIAALKVGLYLLRRTVDDPAQCRTRLDSFETQVDRLTALVAELLDADRLERSTRVPDAEPTALEPLLAPVIAAGAG
jgi:PAS domain S-box-containing protein